MSASPGHKKYPDHKVEEEHLDDRVEVYLGDRLVADSNDVIKVVEDEHPDRFYFPREDVMEEYLESSQTTTECPFKGTAHYFSLKADGKQAKDAVWVYENPYEEHRDLKGRLAFYDEKVDGLRISPVV